MLQQVGLGIFIYTKDLILPEVMRRVHVARVWHIFIVMYNKME